ncbi:uncharacterized protein mlana [Paramormyrops kingsleyae]|uniref:Melan-A n=1 Tax=Paramormyrops kingsleyae TaxID=1676925 RepID=A0A3B3QBU5_9TELE|nr:melanoma antigen recognized by T-cells 1 isoform X2 [Paramormyrops kingsleyae]XP_023687695.1 melanoma antigen recognized by T-cells 1 isoform X2 [Paramormyrops kingsleyae]XP_023687696.1 melanoma antigen recognized by T-cells 1 isoform X2 [Paramormyrops kingsleyae]
MPRRGFDVHFESKGGGYYVRAEEAAAIALLVIVFAALLIIGCWYYRRRSGYKMIQGSWSGPSWRSLARPTHHSEEGAAGGNKVALDEFTSFRRVIPNAPPAYEKISSGPSPPPYSP